MERMLLENPLFDSQRAWKDGGYPSQMKKRLFIRMIQRNIF